MDITRNVEDGAMAIQFISGVGISWKSAGLIDKISDQCFLMDKTTDVSSSNEKLKLALQPEVHHVDKKRRFKSSFISNLILSIAF